MNYFIGKPAYCLIKDDMMRGKKRYAPSSSFGSNLHQTVQLPSKFSKSQRKKQRKWTKRRTRPKGEGKTEGDTYQQNGGGSGRKRKRSDSAGSTECPGSNVSAECQRNSKRQKLGEGNDHSSVRKGVALKRKKRRAKKRAVLDDATCSCSYFKPYK